MESFAAARLGVSKPRRLGQFSPGISKASCRRDCAGSYTHPVACGSMQTDGSTVRARTEVVDASKEPEVVTAESELLANSIWSWFLTAARSAFEHSVPAWGG